MRRYESINLMACFNHVVYGSVEARAMYIVQTWTLKTWGIKHDHIHTSALLRESSIIHSDI